MNLKEHTIQKSGIGGFATVQGVEQTSNNITFKISASFTNYLTSKNNSIVDTDTFFMLQCRSNICYSTATTLFQYIRQR